MLVTNFTRSGRPADRKGVDRFEAAAGILKGIDISTAGHYELLNGISRSGKPILRDISSSSIVFEGVVPGEDPLLTVAWTILGCPSTSIYIPLKVFGSDQVYRKSCGQITENRLRGTESSPGAAAADRIKEGDFHEGMVYCELGHDTGRTGNSGSCSACQK